MVARCNHKKDHYKRRCCDRQSLTLTSITKRLDYPRVGFARNPLCCNPKGLKGNQVSPNPLEPGLQYVPTCHYDLLKSILIIFDLYLELMPKESNQILMRIVSIS